MDFRGLVLKRVWKITFFGLKSVHDLSLRKRAAHPHQEFPEVPPPRARKVAESLLFLNSPFLFFISQ